MVLAERSADETAQASSNLPYQVGGAREVCSVVVGGAACDGIALGAQQAGLLLPTVQLRALGTMLHERGATRPLHLDVERS